MMYDRYQLRTNVSRESRSLGSWKAFGNDRMVTSISLEKFHNGAKLEKRLRNWFQSSNSKKLGSKNCLVASTEQTTIENLLGCSESDFVFLVKMEHDFFRVYKHFIKLHILHF
ncbi:uncharacterized protein LOC143143489 [Ptiloglossa arizonensis]|uniref:uncharacterized protein LOC143143489 n=1 Tax=Ptiloglossa arizonensis TaxID=3350558 RepID=UPI003F9F6D7A